MRHIPSDFKNGLDRMERLVIAASDPALRAALLAWPNPFSAGRPWARSRDSLFVFALASVVCGGDRPAESGLRFLWPTLRPMLKELHLDLDEAPPREHHWHSYRQRCLSPDVVDGFADQLSAYWVGAAQHMGFLQATGGSWLDPLPENVVYADGTVFRPLSETAFGDNGERFPDRPGARISKNVDDQGGPSRGHKSIAFFVRKPLSAGKGNERYRMVLRVERSDNYDEMGPVFRGVGRLVELAGSGFRWFVYDGALAGMHHTRLRDDLGVVTINRSNYNESNETVFADGSIHKKRTKRKAAAALELPGTLTRRKDKVYAVDCVDDETGRVCRHWVCARDGVLNEVEETNEGRWMFARIIEHARVERTPTADGFRWELDIVIRCRLGDKHVVTIDPNDKWQPALDRTDILNYPAQVKLYAPNEANFLIIYGLRNDAESAFNWLKQLSHKSGRAMSYDGDYHYIDLLLACAVWNACAFAEHGTSQPVAEAA